MSCGVGCRWGLNTELLWLWCRPVATAPIRPLAWEPPCAAGSGPRKGKNKQTNKQTNPEPALDQGFRAELQSKKKVAAGGKS